MNDPLAVPDFGMDRPSSPSQFGDSSQPPLLPTDLVQWQSTQPLPALNALLKNSTSRRTRRVPHSTCLSASLFPDDISSPDTSPSKQNSIPIASGSRKPASRRTRPRYSDPALLPGPAASTPPTAPPLLLSHSFAVGDEKSSLVDILKSVSKMADENARIKKRHMEKQTSRASAKDSRRIKVKSPEKTNPSQDSSNFKTTVGLKRAQGGIKGKDRQRDFDDPISRDVDNAGQSFPAMDVDIVPLQDVPKDCFDMVREPTSSGSKMPPPPLPAKVAYLPTKVHSSVSSIPAGVHSHSPVSHPAPSLIPTSTPTIPSSHRRPVLGMRRVVNPIVNNTSTVTSSQKSLPSRPKGFKPPLAKPPTATGETSFRQPQHSSRAGNSAPSSSTDQLTSSTVHNNGCSSRVPSLSVPRVSTGPSTDVDRSWSPPPVNEEADSSFGELSSFDMDLLEETMKEYDK